MVFDHSIRSTSEHFEDIIDTLGRPVRPYLPVVSRFLIVATFYEDALRILVQWKYQCIYLENSRHFPRFLAQAFLALNVVAMCIASTSIIGKKWVGSSTCVLTSVIVAQALAYGLVFDMAFFIRNLSVTGGLLMCLSESLLRRRSKNVFAALPQLSESERHKYFQLAGRIMLVLLFLAFVINGEWSLLRGAASLISLAACLMIIVGFRAKWSATLLVTCLCVMNVLVNNWWSVHHSYSTRDFLKYDFFQTLSIMGGFLLLISIGPGGLSYDEKKKEF
ncbi:SURF4 family-domain-containing protein [Radiomyces spectabilis]|uniref:SURF4 family-domain-containing protein n=1 Tax=Radiomyces spectabilis TaxID=64574 RepID=UPI00221FDD9E|nr:SURF4 family-domain-containing protein [Radiomyces spectabilis]KAI8376172.1 SURF4 family-domain-containing protein [Radiomyces spectabilis]